jgi:hypothetical protein
VTVRALHGLGQLRQAIKIRSPPMSGVRIGRDVTAAIARQRQALTDRNRRAGAKQAARTRRAKASGQASA